MRSRIALPALLAFAFVAAGQPVVPLYSGVAPGSETWNWPETEQPATDGIRRIANISKPSLTVFLPDKAKATGTGMVICPGGGFRILAWNHEGEDVARFLNDLGVAAFVLKYRVMRTGDDGEKDKEVMAKRRPEAIAMGVADGLEAMRLVRRRAAEWGVRPDWLGIIGFSAGGWVTTGVVLQGTGDSRPNFAAPIYAAMPENLAVPPQPPPLFLVPKHLFARTASWPVARETFGTSVAASELPRVPPAAEA